MGRKSTITDKRARRYIRILDEDKWAEIDKLNTLKKYQNSFNQLINDALDYGLPLLVKAEFGEVEKPETYLPEEPPAEQGEKNDVEMYYRFDELLQDIAILIEEVILNATINKSLLCSLFNAKSRELSGTPTRSDRFASGDFRDTPEYLETYERRTIKDINKRRRKSE